MALSENETLEYKRQYTPDIKKEVVAFANIVGGTVYIGTDDDGTSVGVHTEPGCRGTAACQRPAGRHPPGRDHIHAHAYSGYRRPPRGHGGDSHRQAAALLPDR